MRVTHLSSAIAAIATSIGLVGSLFAAEEDPTESVSSERGETKDSSIASASSAGTGSSTEATGDSDNGHRHGGQFSLRVAVVGAERIISRYDDSPTCGLAASGTEPKKFCGFAAPVALDLALGFAPLNSIEPFAWARFGLSGESTTHTSPLVVLGAGARLYTARESAFKFFLQPAVGWELESGAGSRPFEGKQYKKDLLLQLLAGPQYDFSDNLGAFAGFGVTAGMLRAIQTWLEIDIGVQARF